jgi:hypothetical protein
MTPKEYSVLSDALQSLTVSVVDDHAYNHNRSQSDQIDSYNYRAIGKMVMGKRMLAELLARPFGNLLPGETDDEEDTTLDEMCRFINPSPHDRPLNNREKQFLINVVLIVLDGVGGLGDGDEACIRVAKRRIAEVAGYPDLGRYRLMMENEVKPLYFQEYQPLVDLK